MSVEGCEQPPLDRSPRLKDRGGTAPRVEKGLSRLHTETGDAHRPGGRVLAKLHRAPRSWRCTRSSTAAH